MEPSQPESHITEFEISLADAERSLLALKERYTQIQSDRSRQAELKQRLNQQPSTQELKAELKRIQDELAALENGLGLFSQSYLMLTFFGGVLILSKSGLKEAFWQVVRFAGLGIVVGWILKSSVG